jgi:hypothetical protein
MALLLKNQYLGGQAMYDGEFFEIDKSLRRTLFMDVDRELMALDGEPAHSLRTALLQRLQPKYPDLTLNHVDAILKLVLRPWAYKLLYG